MKKVDFNKMDNEEAEQLHSEPSSEQQQQQPTTTPATASSQLSSPSSQRRTLASILALSTNKTSIKKDVQKRPKTPSVIVTDETTDLSELTSLSVKRTESGRTSSTGSKTGAVFSVGASRTTALSNGATPLEGVAAVETLSIPGGNIHHSPAGSSSTEGGMQQQQQQQQQQSDRATTPTRPSILRRCCHERVRTCLWGVLIMASVSTAWLGATHLLKNTFRPILVVQFRPTDMTTTTTTTNGIQHGTVSDGEDGRGMMINHSSADVVSSTSDPVEMYTYEGTFLNTWAVSTWTLLFLPLYAIGCLVSGKIGPRKLYADLRESVLVFRDKGFTLGTFLGRCGGFCLLWVGTNWMYMYALSVLDATDVMALFATNITFVYLLSWVVLHIQFVGLRIVAVICCNTGIALLAYMDGITPSPTLGGVVLAAAASAGSAVYKVSFKKMFGDASYGQVSFFFSLIGLLNIVLLWPVLLTLHFSGAEVIVWQRVPWVQLAIAGALSLAANLLGNFGPAVTYEFFVHLGLLIAIPVSAVLDMEFNGVVFEGMKLAGNVMIVTGFLLVLLPENWPDYITRLLTWGRNWKQHNSGPPVEAPVDLRTGYISRSHLRTPSGRVK